MDRANYDRRRIDHGCDLVLMNWTLIVLKKIF